MQYQVLSVFDKKTSTFGNPIITLHVADTEREFRNLVSDTQTKFGKNPEDFVLVHTAMYNASTGQFVNLEQPKYLQEGVSDGRSL